MDAHHLYWYGEKIPIHIELTSLEALGGYYAKNDDTVLFRGKVVPGADAASFVFLGWEYGKDANNVYANGVPINKIYRIVPENHKWFDPDSFMVLNEHYVKDRYCVYWDDWRIMGADLESFQALDCNYAKDKNNVYLQGRVLKGACPQTFQLVLDSWEFFSHHGFICVDECLYSKDATAVYYYRDSIKGADPNSFIPLTAYYAKDKNHVFFNNQAIKEADPATFVVLNEYYTKDRRHVFYNTVVEDHIAPYDYYREFPECYYDLEKIIDRDLGIYYLEGTPPCFYRVVTGADPDSFDVSLNEYAKDKNGMYYRGQRESQFLFSCREKMCGR